MSSRRFVVLAVVITAFVALVIATSTGDNAGGAHTMPDGQTMQDDQMSR